MKEMLVDLMRRANKELKDMRATYHSLNAHWCYQEKRRVKNAATVERELDNFDEELELTDAKERLKGINIGLERLLHTDIDRQLQYITNLANAYAELAKLEQAEQSSEQTYSRRPG